MQRLAVIDVSRLLNHFYMTKYDNKRNKYYFSSLSLLINDAEENHFDFNLSRRRHKFIFYLVKIIIIAMSLTDLILKNK